MEIHISSKEANLAAGDTRSNFNLNLLWNNLTGSNASPPEGYEIFVSDWMVPYTWYGINSNNNVIVFQANALTYAITIPVGTYNASDLAAFLQTTMNSLGAGDSQVFTVTFDSSTGLFTFTKTSGTGTWVFLTTATVASARASPAVAGDYNFSAYPIIGFSAPDSGTSITTAAANSTEVNSTRVVNMMPVDRLFLELNWPEIRSYDSRTHGHNEAMAQMSPPCDCTWGGFINYRASHTTRFRIRNRPHQLNARLVDSDGNEVDLNGHDWYFTLTVYGLEGTTPMTNMMETKHDSRQQTAMYNIRQAAIPTVPVGHHDAPNRAWQGHANATSINQGSHANLNPARRSNPFMNPL